MPTNSGSTMLPLYSLLNPPLPGLAAASSRQSTPPSSLSQAGSALALETLSSSPVPLSPCSSPSSSPSTFSSLSSSSSSSSSRARMDGMMMVASKAASRSIDTSIKCKPQGPVNFAPFEDVDETCLQEVSRFRIGSFGQIHECCEHIPYNSAKKDFFEKTGREGMEDGDGPAVFKYQFQLPGDDNRYTVMWDYNVGLVRMTPFFKCLGYAKTKPSQMLDKNTGLRDITPSVTGGAVSAQGYWMPYRCARAVCATFCHCIAGALIPLFGPRFPMECTPPESSYYREMVISQQIISEARREVELYRRQASNGTAGGGLGGGLGGSHGQAGEDQRRRGPASAPAPTLALALPSRPQVMGRRVESMDGARVRPGHGDVAGADEAWGAPRAASWVSVNAPLARQGVEGILSQSAMGPCGGEEGEETRRLSPGGPWRPKRRRGVQDRVGERGRTVAPETERRRAGRKAEPELDKMKAAAVLVSLCQETVTQLSGLSRGEWSRAIEESSDEEAGSQKKKRPKAHSF